MLIETKLHIPQVRTSLVPRLCLCAILDEGLNCRLTLVTAPPGYGKTTLLSEWATTVKAPIAWVSLDQADNDPVRFWAHSLAALKQANPAFDEQGVYRFATADMWDNSFIAALINGLNRLVETMVLVWDDFHHINDSTIMKGIAYFLERLPTHVHLYIASRSLPPLSLSRLRFSGEVKQLNADDLRFTEQEANAFFERSQALNLSLQERTIIWEQTEGWIAGLNLAVVLLNRKGNRTAIVEEMTGRQREIADYFFEEVFSQQSEELQHFLLKTAILKRMNAGLCQAVTDMSDSPHLLRKLEEISLFLIPLDGQREWYRYHHLFQQFLYMQLQIREAEQVKMLHLAAARWLEKNKLVQEALEHYLAGRAYKEALCLLEKVAPLMKNYEWRTLHTWLNAIPHHVLFKKPMLFLTNLASLFLSGRIEEATDGYWWAVNQLEKNADALSEHEVEKFNAGLSFLVAFRSYLERDFDFAIQYSLEYLQKDPDGALFVGFGVDQDGYQPIWDVDMSTSSLYQTEQVLKNLLSIWSETKNVYFIAHLCIEYGKVLYEWNRLLEAEQYLRRAVDIGRKYGNKTLELTSTYWLARVYTAENSWPIAPADLQDLTMQVDSSRYPSLLSKVELYQSQLYKLRGEMEKVAKWLEKRGLHPQDEITSSMIEEYDLLACSLVALGRTEDAAVLMKRLLQIVDREKQQSRFIRLLIHKSLILNKLGNESESIDVLNKALTLGEKEGYIRSFVDEGKALAPLLIQYLQSLEKNPGQDTRDSLPYVQKLLQLMTPKPKESLQIKEEKRRDLALTAQEIAVLKLIQEGLTNKEIAHELNILPSTVKTHINNMYRKLQAKNRILAVQRAKQLGLLHEQKNITIYDGN